MNSERVAVIGAGVAGLTAAAELAARGLDVVVLERGSAPGGKMREVRVGDARIDAGPTVLTMRWVFDELFETAGASFEEAVTLEPAEVIARHAWDGGARFDLFADIERSVEAIDAFAGSGEARRYRQFCDRAREVYETLEGPYIRSARPTTAGLVMSVGLHRLPELWRIRPFATLWKALGESFHDPRLRQLFGRYATYVGSSPFSAPATLMLVAHVEREGVWLVEGGMHRVAASLAALAERHGARIRTGVEVAHIEASGGRVSGVVTSSGESIPAEAVVCNADVAALLGGRFGAHAAKGVAPVRRAERSLSAVTWCLVGRARGFPLLRHNVFFGHDYRSEFEDVFRHRRLPRSPTVYVCAQDRGGRDVDPTDGRERLFCLVNAPAIGDSHVFDAEEIERCEARAFDLLKRCGLEIETDPSSKVITTPSDFEGLFPSTGGALYGMATHGSRASFRRPGATTSLPGLILAGGSVHPGAGVPMAALSGRVAAAAVMKDLASTSR